jgi:ubiquinone/menaquinone biosynthesis C-methylase UbiE
MPMQWADFYDAELSRHNRHFRAVASVGMGDRVLDIGCGAGQTTRDAARIARNVVGVDTSAEMLEVAQLRCVEEGLRNVAFELGDAQRHVFPLAAFDLCISRFGVMFFGDSSAAFANIARAMCPGARLAWMVWQSQERNTWSGAIRQALTPEDTISANAGKMFSLGDPAVAIPLLSAAGFASIDFGAVNEPVFFGRDVDAALDTLTGLYLGSTALIGVNERAEVQRRLRDLLAAHTTVDGVLFDSHAWIITARRATD